MIACATDRQRLPDRSHQWSWWWCAGRMPRGRRSPRDRRRSRRRRSPRARRASSTCAGRPNAIWRPLRHSTRSQRARLLDVVRRDQHAAPLGRRARSSSASSTLGARGVEAGERLVEQQHRASWTSARAISTRWRWPPDSSPKVRSASSLEADPRERRARAPRSARPGPPPPRQPRERAHQRDVERADGEVEPRALGLRDAAAARRDARARPRAAAARRAARGRASSCRRRWGRARRSARPARSANVTPASTGAAAVADAPARCGLERHAAPRTASARARR